MIARNQRAPLGKDPDEASFFDMQARHVLGEQYDGAQPSDPARLGAASVELTRMAKPPQIFVAGGDGLATITPAIEARLADMRAREALSRSMVGTI